MGRIYVYCGKGDHIVEKDNTVYFAGSEKGFVCKECYEKKEKEQQKEK